jgi:hypothetical protein
MKFFLPELWEENKDGIRCGPFIYQGKVLSDNERPMSARGVFDRHKYMHYCTRYLVYNQARIEGGAIVLGDLEVHTGLRPFGSSRRIDDDLIPSYECEGEELFKKGMLYDLYVLWGGENNDGEPIGTSAKKDCADRTAAEFKLKSTSVLGSSYFWDPSPTLASLWSDFKIRYPGCLSEGDKFCLLFYVEAWAGILYVNAKNPDKAAPRFVEKKTTEEAVDLWSTALFM